MRWTRSSSKAYSIMARVASVAAGSAPSKGTLSAEDLQAPDEEADAGDAEEAAGDDQPGDGGGERGQAGQGPDARRTRVPRMAWDGRCVVEGAGGAASRERPIGSAPLRLVFCV